MRAIDLAIVSHLALPPEQVCFWSTADFTFTSSAIAETSFVSAGLPLSSLCQRAVLCSYPALPLFTAAQNHYDTPKHADKTQNGSQEGRSHC